MPADKKNLGNSLGNGEKNEHERAAAFIRAILAEMESMSPEELERLYTVIALMEKKSVDTDTRFSGCFRP